MKNLVVISFFTFYSCFVFGQLDPSNKECNLNKNGIYYAKLDSQTNIYIRFYDKDSVVTTSSTNNVKMATKYINKEMGDKLMLGKYLTNGSSCNLRVKAKNDFGKVKMDGIISGNRLVLSVINMDDKTTADFVFNFYPIPNL